MNVNIKIEIAKVVVELSDTTARLEAIQKQLETIEGKEDLFMSQVFTDLEALRVAINDATNLVASKIATLGGMITNSMSDAEVARIKSELQAQVDALNALASDPANPVP